MKYRVASYLLLPVILIATCAATTLADDETVEAPATTTLADDESIVTLAATGAEQVDEASAGANQEVSAVTATAPASAIGREDNSGSYYADDGFVRVSDAPEVRRARSVPRTPIAPIAAPNTATSNAQCDTNCDRRADCKCDCDGACDGRCGCKCDRCASKFAKCDLGCDTGCDKGCGDSCCNRLRIGGWLAQGYSTNSDNPLNPPTPNTGSYPVLLNYRNDAYQMNQLYGFIEKETCTGGCGWDFGGRIDVLYGEDYFIATSPGLEERPDGVQHWNIDAGGSGLNGEGRMGVAIPQFYAELALNNFTVKVGHFYALTDYESVMATSNFFYSHSYLFSHSGPFTHSGLLATWKVNDRWTVRGGAVNGWNNLDAESDRASGLASLVWTSCNERTVASLSLVSGDEQGSTPPFTGNRTMYSAVLSHHFNPCWHYVLQHNGAWQQNGVGAGQTAPWYGVNQYLFYSVSDTLRLGVRFEWFNDQSGTRVPITGAPFGAHYYQLTGGINYSPTKNITIRPEIRFDWADFHTPGTVAAAQAFNNVSTNNQRMFGVDAIINY